MTLDPHPVPEWFCYNAIVWLHVLATAKKLSSEPTKGWFVTKLSDHSTLTKELTEALADFFSSQAFLPDVNHGERNWNKASLHHTILV